MAEYVIDEPPNKEASAKAGAFCCLALIRFSIAEFERERRKPMIVHDRDAAAAYLRDLFGSTESAVAFTGAGLSTESGVPDYRSSNSPWMRHKPIPYDLFLADPPYRVEAWRRKFIMDDLYAGAQPSRGHRVLNDLVRAGRLDAIITQNIDNLHQVSGIGPDHLIELHGNGTFALCLDCGKRHELAAIRRIFEETQAAPTCAVCGGIVKSATISFGQAVPPDRLKAASVASRMCDLFVVIGSSLVVYPAASFPMMAKKNQARLVILNREATPLDASADLVLRGDIGDVLAVAFPTDPVRHNEASA